MTVRELLKSCDYTFDYIDVCYSNPYQRAGSYALASDVCQLYGDDAVEKWDVYTDVDGYGDPSASLCIYID